MNNCHTQSKHHVLLLSFFYAITIAAFYLAATSTSTENENLALARTFVCILLLPVLSKYIIQLIALPFYSVKEKFPQTNKQLKSTSTLSVSVIIPAYNEEVGIIKTLKSVLNTHYEYLEIVIVNDGSTDNTHDLVNEFIENEKSDYNAEIKYLKLNNGGKAKALNKALKLASNDIVMTIDGDCLMDKNAITNTVKRFNCETIGAVAGNVIVGNKSKTIEVIQQLEYLCGFFLRRADSVFNSVFIIGGAAAAYRRNVLIEVGDFCTDIVTEDIEMSTRILAAGYKTRYAADAVTFTEGPSNWRCLFDQRLRWKFGRFQTFIKFQNIFFSKNKQHNKYLTWLLLPIAVYAEFILLIEVLVLAVFFTYTFVCNDYLPLVVLITVMATIIMIQICFDSKRHFHKNLFVIAPVAWLMFLTVDIVEFQALYRSLKRLYKKENLQWQKWVRIGL
ncbi:glycosyltransferase [Thalassotalea psychrophila]|uniref:Glycosyltransferase n=1 Tax=Thalassotalea psychrophila TaxID=3065647 RepID=A0ABY9TTK5_9GAMM|nr:glycosyltransferase [Colwelliaceae bacterium SQ149]